MVLQGCYDGATVVLRGCYDGATVVLQGCYGGATGLLRWCYRVVMVVLLWFTERSCRFGGGGPEEKKVRELKSKAFQGLG